MKVLGVALLSAGALTALWAALTGAWESQALEWFLVMGSAQSGAASLSAWLSARLFHHLAQHAVAHVLITEIAAMACGVVYACSFNASMGNTTHWIVFPEDPLVAAGGALVAVAVTPVIAVLLGGLLLLK